MTFYSKESKIAGYIVYSQYGLISHVVMNEYGVVFGINPLTSKPETAKIFPTLEEAEAAKNDFYNCTTSVVLVTKFETDHFVMH